MYPCVGFQTSQFVSRLLLRFFILQSIPAFDFGTGTVANWRNNTKPYRHCTYIYKAYKGNSKDDLLNE